MQGKLKSGREVDPTRSLLPIDIQWDILLIRKTETEAKTTEAGVIVHNFDNDKYTEGEIMCKGPGTEKSPVTVDLRDKVLFYHGAALEYYIKNENDDIEPFYIIRASDIIAVL